MLNNYKGKKNFTEVKISMTLIVFSQYFYSYTKQYKQWNNRYYAHRILHCFILFDQSV